jgi:hypothetical protein
MPVRPRSQWGLRHTAPDTRGRGPTSPSATGLAPRYDGAVLDQPPEASPEPLPEPDPEPPPSESPPAPPRRPLWRRPIVLIPGIAVAVGAVAAVAAPVVWTGSQSGPYTSLPAGCALVPAATLATYAPHATAAPQHGQPAVGCTWTALTAQGSRELMVWAVIYDPSMGGSKTAAHDFALAAREKPPSASPPLKVIATKTSVTGLGDQAEAEIDRLITTGTPSSFPMVILNVWSRNADLTVTYYMTSAGVDPLPTAPRMLSDTIAIARAVLAVLANHA